MMVCYNSPPTSIPVRVFMTTSRLFQAATEGDIQFVKFLIEESEYKVDLTLLEKFADHVSLLICNNKKLSPEQKMALNDLAKNKLYFFRGNVFYQAYCKNSRDKNNLARACIEWGKIYENKCLSAEENLLLGQVLYMAKQEQQFAAEYLYLAGFSYINSCRRDVIIFECFQLAKAEKMLFILNMDAEKINTAVEEFEQQKEWFAFEDIMKRFLIYLANNNYFGAPVKQFELYIQLVALKFEAEKNVAACLDKIKIFLNKSEFKSVKEAGILTMRLFGQAQQHEYQMILGEIVKVLTAIMKISPQQKESIFPMPY